MLNYKKKLAEKDRRTLKYNFGLLNDSHSIYRSFEQCIQAISTYRYPKKGISGNTFSCECVVRKVNPTIRTEEWIKEAKVGVLFKKIAINMKEGKPIEFDGIGINNTPYSKLMNSENKPKTGLTSKLSMLNY